MLDGIGDRSHDILSGQTPLQAARTPVLDRLAAGGANGVYYPALKGQALPSENAHFAMFGYDLTAFPGRGALEALGADIDFDRHDVAVLSHLVSVTESRGRLILKEAKPKVPENEVVELVHAVREYKTDEAVVRFRHVKGIYGILILSGQVAPFFTDSDPFIHERHLVSVRPWAAYARDPDAINAATAMGRYLSWAYHCLRDHPVNRERKEKGQNLINALVSQRAGQLKPVIPFRQRYGLRGLSIASGIVYRGLAAYLGMDFHPVAETQDIESDMARRLRVARNALEGYDFIHVHTKAPDEAAHAKDPVLKKTVIESLDRGIGKVIDSFADDPQVFIVVSADHSTPSSGSLIHSGESVPMTFYGKGVRKDGVDRFDEINVSLGALGNVQGKELMYLILNHLDRAKLHGVMDTPVDQPFWPGDYEPFQLEDLNATIQRPK